MQQKLETIINELREMRGDMQRLGESMLPNEPVLQAAVEVAKSYNAVTMCGFRDTQTVEVPVGDMRKLVAAIANVK